MIGNDVVDIVQARKESNWQREGWVQKVFTPKEQALILSSANRELMAWTLWSMKEAAYKAYNRITGHRAFIPHQLKCVIQPKQIVVCNGFSFHCITSVTDSVVNTVTVAEESNLKKIVALNKSEVIKYKNSLPSFIFDEKIAPASVSHHGNTYKAIGLMI